MNLFDDLPERLDEEVFEELTATGAVRIERIVSRGHASPPDFWYDQSQHEWVAVLRGRARLELAGSADEVERVELGPGDHLMIEAHRRHRVAWTDPDVETIWLAVHVTTDDEVDEGAGDRSEK